MDKGKIGLPFAQPCGCKETCTFTAGSRPGLCESYCRQVAAVSPKPQAEKTVVVANTNVDLSSLARFTGQK